MTPREAIEMLIALDRMFGLELGRPERQTKQDRRMFRDVLDTLRQFVKDHGPWLA